MQINSDLAVEFAADLLQSSNTKCKNTDAVQRVEITEKSLFSDRCGVYYDINCEQAGEDIENIFANCISEYGYNTDRILFVGLGNAKYISDALGEMVLDNLPPPNDRTAKFKPQVGRITGIESHDLIISAKKIVKPTVIIAIDSLATNDITKVGKSIQITNVGLIPGSGVGNSRKILTSKSLGVPILAIGVPLVANIKINENRKLVIPIDIEDIAEKLAKTISNGIRLILH